MNSKAGWLGIAVFNASMVGLDAATKSYGWIPVNLGFCAYYIYRFVMEE